METVTDILFIICGLLLLGCIIFILIKIIDFILFSKEWDEEIVHVEQASVIQLSFTPYSSHTSAVPIITGNGLGVGISTTEQDEQDIVILQTVHNKIIVNDLDFFSYAKVGQELMVVYKKSRKRLIFTNKKFFPKIEIYSIGGYTVAGRADVK